jgi:FkbM family methyltransferase
MTLRAKAKTALSMISNGNLKSAANAVSENINKAWWRTRSVVHVDNCTISLDGVVDENRFLLFDGRYERHERSAVRELMDRSLPVIEIGGSIGVVACVTNKLLVNPKQHVVVEANPFLMEYLLNNRRLNKCSFSVVNAALAYGGGLVKFNVSDDALASGLGDYVPNSEPVIVPGVTLQGLIHIAGFKLCTFICDIEGYEYELVKTEPEALRKHVSTLIIETHERFIGKDKNDEMLAMLQSLGFVVQKHYSNVLVFRNSQIR